MDRYVVIGNPVSHSKSPRIHRMFADATGQQLEYRTLQAPLDAFTSTAKIFFVEGGRGANITVPFKEEAFQLADVLSPRAQSAGAVNTLWTAADGLLHGDNTDGVGLVRDITGNLDMPLAGQRILLLGAGGAARGVILPLLQERPSELFIANRSPEKAVQLAALSGNVNVRGGGFSQLAGQSFDVVINATSTGLSDTALPIPPDVFAHQALAYEMVYGRDTAFMQQAAAGKARVADGLGMLVEQAAESFFVWRGVRPDTAPVIAALRAS